MLIRSQMAFPSTDTLSSPFPNYRHGFGLLKSSRPYFRKGALSACHNLNPPSPPAWAREWSAATRRTCKVYYVTGPYADQCDAESLTRRVRKTPRPYKCDVPEVVFRIRIVSRPHASKSVIMEARGNLFSNVNVAASPCKGRFSPRGRRRQQCTNALIDVAGLPGSS